MRPIEEVANDLGIQGESLSPYGKWMAKVSLEAQDLSPAKRGKLVIVSAMTPTPYGEGKTVTSIGLAMALRKLGRSSVVCVRQPSLGPVFGIKGGGAGGGRATVEPTQEVNMRFTGDIDAVAAAHNLLSAVVDNHIFHGNPLGIDPVRVTWRRALDLEDRALRNVRVGLSADKGSVPRDDGFMVAAASEVMAVLCLSETYADLKRRLDRMVVGFDRSGGLVRAEKLKVGGAMAALLRDAMLPNLVQTSEGTPALVHGGPFGNIAHGTSSLASIKLGLSRAEYCVVEAGFATDLGAEKFFDIVARTGGLDVDAVVVVATVRALRHHGGASDAARPDAQAVGRGLENLAKHIENARLFGLDPVVAVNQFSSDTEEELRLVSEFCEAQSVNCARLTAFSDGGAGATELAALVVAAAGTGAKGRPLYSLDGSIEAKIEKVSTLVYGADGVSYSDAAMESIRRLRDEGFEGYPICVAKTPLSLSDDPHKLGRPRGFVPTVRDVVTSAGAAFNVVYMGDIVTMPGLPSSPAAERISLSDQGEISGVA